ncbi:hypothetical protein AYK87_10400 [Stutzerimonas stutzeri]|nr:hypothetical protein AYK87_10400 [Stutzerimonas stutzeri]
MAIELLAGLFALAVQGGFLQRRYVDMAFEFLQWATCGHDLLVKYLGITAKGLVRNQCIEGLQQLSTQSGLSDRMAQGKNGVVEHYPDQLRMAAQLVFGEQVFIGGECRQWLGWSAVDKAGQFFLALLKLLDQRCCR